MRGDTCRKLVVRGSRRGIRSQSRSRSPGRTRPSRVGANATQITVYRGTGGLHRHRRYSKPTNPLHATRPPLHIHIPKLGLALPSSSSKHRAPTSVFIPSHFSSHQTLPRRSTVDGRSVSLAFVRFLLLPLSLVSPDYHHHHHRPRHHRLLVVSSIAREILVIISSVLSLLSLLSSLILSSTSLLSCRCQVGVRKDLSRHDVNSLS